MELGELALGIRNPFFSKVPQTFLQVVLCKKLSEVIRSRMPFLLLSRSSYPSETLGMIEPSLSQSLTT